LTNYKKNNSKNVFNFKNSYVKLSNDFFQRINPVPVKEPNLLEFNEDLSDFLNLDTGKLKGDLGKLVFSGNLIPDGSDPIALAYAGHQFGDFVPQLGDGRAILIGEVIGKDKKKYDIQLKGSGLTRFSRQGDGRAPLGPVIREFLMSEAIFHLNIPTTRSLAMVSTGEFVKRETFLPSGILTRVASSHVRVGTFEYFSYSKNYKSLKKLIDYSINRHFKKIKKNKDLYLSFFYSVMILQAKLVSSWMNVGFIHGVMNTDNTLVSGETIDYGPCAFMDFYNPSTVFSFIDTFGRYSYKNQGQIVMWNLAKLAESILPLIDKNLERAKKKITEILLQFPKIFEDFWIEGMRKKFGLFTKNKKDFEIFKSFLELLQMEELDFTSTFRKLSSKTSDEKFDDEFLKEFKNKRNGKNWLMTWKKRIYDEKKSLDEVSDFMKANNPIYIPRNHLIERAIKEAVHGNDFSFMRKFLSILRSPYRDLKIESFFSAPPRTDELVKKTFCGT